MPGGVWEDPLQHTTSCHAECLWNISHSLLMAAQGCRHMYTPILQKLRSREVKSFSKVTQPASRGESAYRTRLGRRHSWQGTACVKVQRTECGTCREWQVGGVAEDQEGTGERGRTGVLVSGPCMVEGKW